MVYVMLLGYLQRRRFEREAAARGVALEGSSTMLGAAVRLALAAAIAASLGLVVRAYVVRWLPGTQVTTILSRAALLCTFGIAAYGFGAWLLGVGEISELKNVLRRKLGFR
jgi:putative peptidoglycan lipid II flippase